METETLMIDGIQERESKKTGEPFWVIKTDKGDYTCFEEIVFDELAKNEGKVCEVETYQKGKYNNIRAFIGVAEGQNVKTEKVVKSNAPVSFAKVEMLVSYAKDIFIAGKAVKLEDAAKAVIKAYQDISKAV